MWWQIVSKVFGSFADRATERIAKKVGETVGERFSKKLRPLEASELHLPHDVKVVPKGLKSFDERDASFFLRLLPGPFRESGLPESIHFWKTRIEEFGPDKTFSVGLIYGPSGCGKSSLVKAGLIPQLNHSITTVYVEATPGDTESRLVAALRRHCPYLKPKSSLRTALGRKHNIPAGTKVVLILDQFEQYLHSTPEDEQKRVIDALRECDGERLQCILMVRDEFITPVTRFFTELDVELSNARNYRLVDLFDVRHAKKVLALFGRAFGALTPATGITKTQDEFLDQAVSMLAEGDYVIPVRLALFADIVRPKDWTPATLKAAGGETGVGVAFLEDSFSVKSAPLEHRRHVNAARRLLGALLPDVSAYAEGAAESGAVLKGAMKTRQELLEKSGYSRQPEEFEKLLEILSGRLRLITPAEQSVAELGDAGIMTADPAQKEQYFQLTHDYMVPALREWLTQEQKRTWSGRASLRLAERAVLWNAKPETSRLPAFWESVNIWLFTRSRDWTEPQRKMMRQATRVHGLWSGIVAVVLLLLGVAGFALSVRFKEDHADELVRNLRNFDIDRVPDVIDEIGAYRQWTDTKLRQLHADPETEPEVKLRAALALLPVEPEHADDLRDQLLLVGPAEFRLICRELHPHGQRLRVRYWKILDDEDDTAGRRFRAAAALATYDADSERWPDYSAFVAEQLVSKLPSKLVLWRDALRPVKEDLLKPLREIYEDPSEGESARLGATETLINYYESDPEACFDLLADADDIQFPILFETLSDFESRAIQLAKAELQQTLPQDASDQQKERLAKRQANAAVVLFRLGEEALVWPLLKFRPDPRLRSYVIHWLRKRGGDPEALLSRLKNETDVSARRALILCLGGFDDAELPETDRERLIERLLSIYRSDRDSGVRAAAEWALRRWEQQDRIAALDEELMVNEQQLRLRGGALTWYVNTQGQTMVILKAGTFLMGSPGCPQAEADRDEDETLHEQRIDRRFAIAAKEATREQIDRCEKVKGSIEMHAKNIEDYAKTGDSPQVYITWHEAALYCNWLSGQEQIPKDQWCYEWVDENDPRKGMKAKPNALDLVGYRLPMEAEWEYACRAGTTSSRYYGSTDLLLHEYGWYLVNADFQTHPVGRLKPNDFGLFDMHGNVWEWCHDDYGSYHVIGADRTAPEDPGSKADPEKVLRSGAYSYPADYLRSADRTATRPVAPYFALGFRPARTMP